MNNLASLPPIMFKLNRRNENINAKKKKILSNL